MCPHVGGGPLVGRVPREGTSPGPLDSDCRPSPSTPCAPRVPVAGDARYCSLSKYGLFSMVRWGGQGRVAYGSEGVVLIHLPGSLQCGVLVWCARETPSFTLLGGLWTLYLVFASGQGHSSLHQGMVDEAANYSWRTSLLDVVVVASAMLLVLLALQRSSRAQRRHFKQHNNGGLSRAHDPVCCPHALLLMVPSLLTLSVRRARGPLFQVAVPVPFPCPRRA
jgi:hypothetical protein